MTTVTITASGDWIAPFTGNVLYKLKGSGGSGEDGGGGACACVAGTFAVTKDTVYPAICALGSDTEIFGKKAKKGGNASGQSGGLGGTAAASIGDRKSSGGNGGFGDALNLTGGGGGGSGEDDGVSSADGSNGEDGTEGGNGLGGSPGFAGEDGRGGDGGGGSGADYGGGAGGSGDGNPGHAGARGAPVIVLNFTAPSSESEPTMAGRGGFSCVDKISFTSVATMGAAGGFTSEDEFGDRIMTERFFSDSLGDDTLGDGTKKRPWKSHSKFNSGGPTGGDVCYLLRGDTWAGSFIVPADNITIKPYGDPSLPAPKLDGAGGATDRVVATSRTGVVVDGLEITGSAAGFSGIKFATSANASLVANCNIHDNGKDGIYFATGISGTNVIVQDCTVKNNGTNGLEVLGTIVVLASRCVISGHNASGCAGIYIGATANCLVLDNTIIDNVRGIFSISTLASGTLEVRRNIVRASRDGIRCYPSAPTSTYLLIATDNVIAISPDLAGDGDHGCISVGNAMSATVVCNTFTRAPGAAGTAPAYALFVDDSVKVRTLGNDFKIPTDATQFKVANLFDKTVNVLKWNGNSYPEVALLGNIFKDVTAGTSIALAAWIALGWDIQSSATARGYTRLDLFNPVLIGEDQVTVVTPVSRSAQTDRVSPNLSIFTSTDLRGNARSELESRWIPGAVAV